MTDLTPRRRRAILAICCMSLFIVGLDNTIVNVALPAIQTSLHASVSGLQWTVDAYTLVLASLLLLSGSTADRLGRRRVFQTGLVLFTVASLACSLAPGLGWLVGFRALQAIGGSMLNPVAMSIITNVFIEPKERARAIGVWAGVVGISLALGPVIGGVLVDSVGWRAIFIINIPVGLAAVGLTQVFVPESRAEFPRRPDVGGQVLVILTLGTLIYAIITGPEHGWGSTRVAALFAVSAVSAVGLIRYELRRREPLLDMRFFRSVPFACATVSAVCAFMALGGFLFLNTLYLQDVQGRSATMAGLLTLPLAAMALVFGPVSGRIVGTRGPRVPLLLAGTSFAIATIMLANLTDDTSIARLLLAYVVFGFGFGFVNTPITNAAVSGMPRAQAGVASAVASTSRQVGQSLGVAVVGSLVTSQVHGSLKTGLAAASHPAWWTLTGCGVVILVLGAVATTAWARASAARTAELFAEPVLPVPVPA
jgi:EmrB/QacA subfamily drug resistance transporter